MGMDCDSWAVYGFYLDIDDLYDHFLVKIEEKSHTEQRWDAKTGKQLADVVVVDQPARDVLMWDGSDIGECELGEMLAEHTGLTWFQHSDKFDTNDNGVLGFDIGGCTVKDLACYEMRLKKAYQKLKALKFKLKNTPKIYSVLFLSY